MTGKFQVAVIGAGPGGSIAAAMLATRGIDTVIVDRDLFPRDKLCGGFLSYDAAPILADLGLWDRLRARGANVITHARILADGAIRSFDLPESALAVSRYLLDEALLLDAQSRGATALLGWTVDSCTYNGHSHELLLARGPERQIVKSNVVIGAWGRWSRLDISLARPFASSRRRYFGLAQYGAARNPELTETVDLYASSGAYVGAAQVEGGRTNLCGLVGEHLLRTLRGDVNAWLMEVSRSSTDLRQAINLASPLDSEIRVSPPVIFKTRAALVDHILTIGDAAAVLPPVIGGGMASSIQTALLAADAASQIVFASGRRPAIENQFARNMTLLLRRRRLWAKTLELVISRHTICAFLLRASTGGLIRRVIVQQSRSDTTQIEYLMNRWRRGEPLDLNA